MPVAAYNVSGEYAMIKAAAGAGPARRARRRARGADRHPPRRRRHRDHLPREGRRPMAQPVAPRSAPRKDGAADPARRDRQEAAQPDAGLVRRSTERPFARVAELAGLAEDEVLQRVQRLLDKRIIREITPIFDTRALGYSLDARRGQGRPRATRTARRKFINSHPGVTHNYLRNHEFNLWFTIAVEPDSKLGLDGTLDVIAAKTGAESIRQLPTLKLFKIRMDLEMEAGTDALASRRRGGRAAASSTRSSSRRVDVATIRATQGADGGRAPSPTRRPPSGSACPSSERARAPASRCASAAGCAAWRRSSTTAAPASPPTAWACGRCRRTRSSRPGKRMAAFRGISHCYQRPTYADWPYSVFTMAHGRSKEECDAVLDAIAEDDRHHRARDAVLEHRVQEGPDALLHRRLHALGSGARGAERLVLAVRHALGRALPRARCTSCPAA